LELLKITCESIFEKIDKYENKLDIEFIIVDNGSGEDVLHYIQKTERFNKIIANELNLGIAKALNQGYQAAEGEFIFTMDDDWKCQAKDRFFSPCLEVINEFEDIGACRLKFYDSACMELPREGNFFVYTPDCIPHKILPRDTMRNIGDLRKTASGVEFYSWMPHESYPYNVWACSCVLFRKAGYEMAGPLNEKLTNIEVEPDFAGRFSKFYLAAKILNNMNIFQHMGKGHKSPGWKDFEKK
jgi:glycosyltransferase involved in cell wall biosynthesis